MAALSTYRPSSAHTLEFRFKEAFDHDMTPCEGHFEQLQSIVNTFLFLLSGKKSPSFQQATSQEGTPEISSIARCKFNHNN
jgi:hypothetical protein